MTLGHSSVGRILAQLCVPSPAPHALLCVYDPRDEPRRADIQGHYSQHREFQSGLSYKGLSQGQTNK